MNKDQSESSIVSIIREMVKSGESEETIIKSLKELGIDEKKAKKLLLLGEADTFALLQNEINKMVKEYYDKEKPGLRNYITEQFDAQEKQMVQQVEKRALNAFKEDQKFIENQATMFQARINQSVKNILQLNQETKRNISELAGRISNNERDMWTLKERIFGSKLTNIASHALLALEIGLVAATSFLLITNFGGTSTETLTIGAIIGAILAAMVFFIRLKL